MVQNAMTFQCAPFEAGWEAVRDEWHGLFKDCEAPCGFYHPLLIGATLAFPAPDRPTHLVLGRSGGKLVWGFPARIRSLGLLGREIAFYAPSTEGWDHLAPLDASPNHGATREFFDRAAWRLGAAVVTARSAAAELGEMAREAAPAGQRFFVRPAFRCPFLLLPPSEAGLLAGVSHKFRQTLRQGLRRAEAGRVSFRATPEDASADCLEAALDRLLTLHAGRFGGNEAGSRFLQPAARAFHRRLMRQAPGFPGAARIFELVLGDTVIASNYGFISGGAYFFYQSGFDQKFSEYSPGRVLLYRVMVWCVEARIRLFDFLRGMDDYKLHWSGETREDVAFFAGRPSTVNYLRLRRSIKRQGRRRGLLDWAGGRD